MKITLHIVLVIAATICLVPFFWLICASIKPAEHTFDTVFLPWGHLHDLSLDNFRSLFQRRGFNRWLVNSIYLSSLQTVLVVTLSSLGGFALAKYEFRFKKFLMAIMLATLLLPYQVLLPSSYELINTFGWMNSYFAIIVPGAVSVFGIFLFRQAMQGVPDELLQAARVDGCSELRLWWDIALPVVRPMVGAFTLMAFLGAWNSYLWPSIVLLDEGKYTLPMGLANMVSLQNDKSDYGALMAGTLISILPTMLLFFALQKDFIAGLTSGALKG